MCDATSCSCYKLIVDFSLWMMDRDENGRADNDVFSPLEFESEDELVAENPEEDDHRSETGLCERIVAQIRDYILSFSRD